MKSLAFLLSLSLVASHVVAASFPDTATSQFEKEIAVLKASGAVQGYPDDGTFRPDTLLNRAEFVKILIEYHHKVSGGDPGKCFTDFSSGGLESAEWYYAYACKAKVLGYVYGYPDGSFGGTKNINLAEALKIVMQAEHVYVQHAQKSEHWFDPYFAVADTLSLFKNIPRDPAHDVTRGEMAYLVVLVGRALETSTNTVQESSGQGTFEQERSRRESQPPVLAGYGIDFGAMDDGHFGDFYDPAEAAAGEYFQKFRPFDPFGAPGFGASHEISSSLNFWVKPNTLVRSPISGVVTSVEFQELHRDYEIHLRRSDDDWWIVSFDHVMPLDDEHPLKTLLGTRVSVGDIIARVGNQSPYGNLDPVADHYKGFVELQVNFENHFGERTHYFQEIRCPAHLLEPVLRVELDNAVAALMRLWEAAKRDTTLYDESLNIDSPACAARILGPPVP